MTSAGETSFLLVSGNDAATFLCLCMWLKWENNNFFSTQACGLKQEIY